MNALRKKLNSRRGASILLALLFLLVCMMVGATVVMAAASNAGKVNSNKTEQQKYLTLSSALTLLCDKLEKMQYTGKYTYVGSDPEKVEPVDPEDPPIYIYTWTYTALSKQEDAMTDWELGDVLPLQDHLDYVVAQLFYNKNTLADNYSDEYSDIVEGDDGDVTVVKVINKYTWEGDLTAPTDDDPYYLELQVTEPSDLEGGIKNDKVRITVVITYPEKLLNSAEPVSLQEAGPVKIDLTAVLLAAVVDEDNEVTGYDETTYRMYAHLESDAFLEAPDYGAEDTAGTLKWHLKYISKTGGTT